MFLMMAEVLHLRRVADALPDSGLWKFLADHQTHVPWTGCSLHDLIQPSFSFLVGVPTLLAAGGLETLQALRHPAGPPTKWGMLALGTVVSAVVAFLVVRWLLRWVQTHSFAPFGWYRIVLGLLMLARFV